MFVFEIPEWRGELSPDDPDGYVLEARFFQISEAIHRLEQLPIPGMRDPVVVYLKGEARRGTTWLYRRHPNSSGGLVARLPGRI